MKVVYNNCFGGFSLSKAAVFRYFELQGKLVYPEDVSRYVTYWLVPPSERPATIAIGDRSATPDEHKAFNEAYAKWVFYDRDLDRADPILVQVVEELGEKASGLGASLAIEDVPSGSRYRIDEYDGNESVMLESDYDWRVAS